MAWDKGKKGEQDAAEKGAAPSETEKGATAEKGGRDGAAQAASRAAGAAAGAARGAGRGIAAGFTALRDVRDASREHSSAKTQMEAMEKDLAAKRAALEHRESIEAGYDGKPVLRLGDFGCAPLASDAAGDFAAPEVLCGDAPTAEHDLYSLGMVLYWLLNDKRVPFAPPSPAPISAADLAIARDMRLRGDPMPVPAHGSSALQQVILTAIADRPEERFRTADEFRAALQSAVQTPEARCTTSRSP